MTTLVVRVMRPRDRRALVVAGAFAVWLALMVGVRFELVHMLLSLAHQDRVRVHTPLAEGESAPTCTDLWAGAAYMERECYDMFGIRFDGHPDLRRILLEEGWEGHPLLKSYAVDTPHPPYR